MTGCRPCARFARSLRRAPLREFAVVITVLTGVFPALARAEAILCLPPEAPMITLPNEVLAKYRAEISAEFEAYFGAVTSYIACLDDERAGILDEARAATEAYSRLINTIPAARNTP